ncbi:DUF3990 domain-containing protein [uncultured Faecalibaculum sp.]|uniref:DUF3990 domain-containing protein n=1 Tax=uncultured Faecalibaculum sp. TaxID=1729681 RepID=UPI00272A6B30|nr:DUF3990 domain-containing protein [uncultured Faecalibaculum sp.]
MNKPNVIRLFHGSRDGLHGDIAPISRDKCDFGAGFYMGTVIWQPLTLIHNEKNPVLYTVVLDLSGLNVLELEPDLTWALVIAFHRGKLDVYKDLPIYKAIQNYVSGYDVIKGLIANDRMFVVLDRFFQGDITDAALIHSLMGLELGEQYVAVSKKACSQISILEEKRIDESERQSLKSLSANNRKVGIELVEKVARQYRREGRYFDEIVENWNESEFGSKAAL